MKEIWTEISVVVEEKLFTLINHYLEELGSCGSFTDSIVNGENEEKTSSIKGYLIGSIKENEEEVEVFKAFVSTLGICFSLKDIGSVDIKETSQKDWDGWKENFKPTKVSKRVIVKPSWEDYNATNNEVVVDIDPGMAFGTGTHGTTKRCIEFLDQIIKGGEDVFDLGTGSGILAITAAKLGAKHVLATDIDKSALNVAKENIENNKVTFQVDLSTIALKKVTKIFDVIVANILAEDLILMKEDIVSRVKSGGRIVLSGILTTKARQVAESYENGNMILEDILEENEWSTLLLKNEL